VQVVINCSKLRESHTLQAVGFTLSIISRVLHKEVMQREIHVAPQITILFYFPMIYCWPFFPSRQRALAGKTMQVSSMAGVAAFLHSMVAFNQLCKNDNDKYAGKRKRCWLATPKFDAQGYISVKALLTKHLVHL